VQSLPQHRHAVRHRRALHRGKRLAGNLPGVVHHQRQYTSFQPAKVSRPRTRVCRPLPGRDSNHATFRRSFSLLFESTMLDASDIRVSATLQFAPHLQCFYMANASEMQRMTCLVVSSGPVRGCPDVRYISSRGSKDKSTVIERAGCWCYSK